MTDTVTPTQADIDASDTLEENMDGHWTEPMRVFVAKAFARHRIAAEATQAAEIARLSREVDRLKADNVAYSAQCKKLADRSRKLAGALDAHPPVSVNAGTWWYPEGDTSSDVCCHGPNEVVENIEGDLAEGDQRVIVIERALSLPDVYGLIRVFTDAEKAARDDDEPWVLDLYATEDEANAALSGQPSEQEKPS